MNVVIRDADPDETSLLVRIMVESGTYTGQVHTGRLPAATRPALATRVATTAGQVCGFAELLRVEPADAELDLFFVHQQWRGQGVGRALLADALRIASDLSVVRTRIVAHPPAEGFFRRLGAQRVSTRPPTEHVAWFCPVLELGVHRGAVQPGSRMPALVGS